MDRLKENLLKGILYLSGIHLVGIWLLKSDMVMDITYPAFPINLILCAAFLFYYQVHWNINAILFIFLSFLVGFLIQVFGVNTGYFFGPFEYKGGLGPELWNTPIVIGIHWMLLLYCIGVLLKNLNYTKVQKSLIGAFMLVLYDIVLEPIAKKNDLWFWLTKKDPLAIYNPIPLQNYACWFLFSFLMLLYFNNAKAKLRNPIAPAVFLIMFFFLVAMHMF